MAFITYILYSASIDQYYTGITTQPIEGRLARHNQGYYNDNWTAQGIPWEEFLVIECDHLAQARSIESHIKRMKSRKYIENLKSYPEMVARLKSKYE